MLAKMILKGVERGIERFIAKRTKDLFDAGADVLLTKLQERDIIPTLETVKSKKQLKAKVKDENHVTITLEGEESPADNLFNGESK